LYETNPTDEATHSERHFFVSRSIGFCTSKNEPTSVQIFFFRKKKYKQTNKNSKTKSKYINARYSKPLSNFFSLLFKDGGEEKNQFAKDETPPQ